MIVYVSIGPSNEHQTWVAWSTYSRRWDAPHMYYGGRHHAEPLGNVVDLIPAGAKETILDLLYTRLFLNGISLSLRGYSMDPEFTASIPPPGWRSHRFAGAQGPADFSYWSNHLPIVQGALERIRRRNDTPVLFLRGDSAERWMNPQGSGVGLDLARIPDWANWAWELLDYFYRNNLQFDYFSVQNEPDGQGVTAPILAAMTQALLQRLGSDPRFQNKPKVLVPETVTPIAAFNNSYLGELQSPDWGTPPLIARLGGLCYHQYDYDPKIGNSRQLPRRPPRDSLNSIRNYTIPPHNLKTFMPEMSDDVKDDRNSYWNGTTDQAVQWAKDCVDEMVEANVSGITLMWNFWSNVNPTQGINSYVNLGLSRQYSQSSGWSLQYTGHQLPPHYHYLSKFVNHIRSGMIRVDATSTDPHVQVVAFRDAASLVIVAVNDRPQASSVPEPVMLSLNGGQNQLLGSVGASYVEAFTIPLP
jgi:hypothetical protein